MDINKLKKKLIMKKVIRLTEDDITRIVRRVINEQGQSFQKPGEGVLNDEEKYQQMTKRILPKSGYSKPSKISGHPGEKYCKGLVDYGLYIKGANVVCVGFDRMNKAKGGFGSNTVQKFNISIDELVKLI